MSITLTSVSFDKTSYANTTQLSFDPGTGTSTWESVLWVQLPLD